MDDHEQVEFKVGASSMASKVYRSSGPQRGGVVMIHGGFGLEPGVLRMARRLALGNYTVIAPDMFHRSAGTANPDVYARIAELTWEDAKADIEAAIAYLRTDRAVPAEKVALLGFCMGGALAWMGAATLPVRTAIAYYPHEIFKPFGKSGPTPIDLTSDIKCPILSHFGDDDTNPSPADRVAMSSRLTEFGVQHQFYHYRQAGHGFVSASLERYRQIPANTSIDRTIGWLDMQLR